MTDWTPEEEAVAKAIVEAASGPFNVLSVRGKETAIREARAAISAMQPRWRDVRTDPPPKDGTHFLGLMVEPPDDDGGRDVRQWREVWYEPRKECGIETMWAAGGYGHSGRLGSETYGANLLVAWSPLPTAPEDSNGK